MSISEKWLCVLLASEIRSSKHVEVATNSIYGSPRA
jgi:hypothetical protein